MADANRTQYVSFSGGLQAHLLDCGWRSDSVVSLQKVQAVVRASNLAVPCPMGGNSFSKFTPQSFKLDLSYSSLDLVDEMLAFQNIFVSAFWKAVPFAPSFKTKTKKTKDKLEKKKNIHVSYLLDSTPRSLRCLQRLEARWGAPRRCSTFPRSRRNTRPRSA